jgi:energy-coupling factor transporter ATP-binding protein EcfA2
MKLVEAHVQKFRNFDDSDPVAIEGDVTALVGKNESGKTAFLQGLYRLNPVYGEQLDELDQYPRWLYTRDRKAGTIVSTNPVTAVFELEPADVEAMATRFGDGVVVAERVTIGRRYDNVTTVGQDAQPDEAKAVAAVLDRSEIPGSLLGELQKCATFTALGAALDKAERPPADDQPVDAAISAGLTSVRNAMTAMLGQDNQGFHGAVHSALRARMPKFFYFGDYHFLAGRTDLQRVYGPEADLKPGERTALALLRLAGADNAALLNEEYERRKAELEAVSNELTDEMADYWSQSKDLDVEIDVDKETQTIPEGQRAVARYLEVRVRDRRHGHTDNIDKRSSGFRWFFSFLAAFSEFEGRPDRIVILLDEPALTLHARAQKDFLRFIDERLAPKHQVIFTTHSPFMVEPGKLHRARLVEDKGARVGSKVTSDVMATDRDTLFPLQAALGYDIAQNLFIAPHNLLLEGTSDFTYLYVMSEHLKTLGRTGLDDRWSLLPVGSVTKITTFLALLGQHLDVTVLVDAGGENKQVADLVRRGLLDSARFITPAQVTATTEADVEDLFDVKDYLALYNASIGSAPLAESDLVGTDRLVKRVERARGDFNHGIPADHLLRNRDTVLPGLSALTLEQFEKLFARVNATLPPA